MGILTNHHAQNAVPIAMKLRLPSRLVQALLSTCAAALTINTPAVAEVPEGYTPVTITDADQLADYTESDYMAFLIGADITDNQYRMAGSHQYWVDETKHTHELTFSSIETDVNGSAAHVEKEIIATNFKKFVASDNISSTSTYNTSTNSPLSNSSNYYIYSRGGTIYGNSGSSITITDNEELTFNNNYVASTDINVPKPSSYYGSYIYLYSYGGAICGGDTCSINISRNNSVEFSGNYASFTSSLYVQHTAYTYGGAIYGGDYSTINLSNNTSVTFIGNYCDSKSTSSYGGAIYGGKSCTINLTGNESVKFSDNYATYTGGAIYGAANSTINITGNETVDFTENVGVAISAPEVNLIENKDAKFCKNSGNIGSSIKAETISIINNANIAFIDNSTLNYGGGIYATTVNITGNDNVAFSKNYASNGFGCGGAIYASTVNINGNNSVTFDENYANNCGAIYTPMIEITDNKNVGFSNNHSNIDGAICSYTSFILTGNEEVAFIGNDSSYNSGAICGGGDFCIIGNNRVEFRGNYIRKNDDGLEAYRLRSVYLQDGSALKLSAGSGQEICFYDTLYAQNSYSGLTVSFNENYEDRDGAMQKANGDIIFSGKFAEVDLKEIKSEFTDRELSNSLTTEIYDTTNLYGGRLRIEDGAIYKGNGINVAEDSGAILALTDATVDQTGFDVTLNPGTTLSLNGRNTIASYHLVMADNSAMNVTLNETNADSALLAFSGCLNIEGNLQIDVTYDEDAAAISPLRILDTFKDDVPEGWNENNICVRGASFDKLQWSEGVLYLNLTGKDISPLTTLKWTGGDMSWNTTSSNWLDSDAPACFEDNCKVCFSDTGAGEVLLEGKLSPRNILVVNSEGCDYFFNGDGELTGGAQLVKDGTGILTINTSNKYTGGTVLNGGTLIAGCDTALGSGHIEVNGGTLDLGGYSITNVISIKEGAEVHLCNGSLSSDFSIKGGVIQIEGLHIEGENIDIREAQEVSLVNANEMYAGGAICGKDNGSINLSDNTSVTFSGNTASEGSAIYSGNNSTIHLANNGSLLFSENQSFGSGTISAMSGSIDIENNGEVSFLYNYSYMSGSAIQDGFGTINISGNDTVSFIDNNASDTNGGGAIQGSTNLYFSDNSSVLFSGNTTGGSGGAINANAIHLINNDSIEFLHSSSNYGGGAIYAYGDINISGNEYIIFSENFTSQNYGGALFCSSYLNITRNDSLTFSHNYSHIGGGAIYSGNELNITNNGSVVFNENYSDAGGTPDAGAGSAIYGQGLINLSVNDSVSFIENQSMYGGSAIYGDVYSTISITNNGNVTFSGNSTYFSSTYGGAILSRDKIILAGNGHVEFRDNCEMENGNFPQRLRGMYLEGSSLEIAAGAEQDIVFYDTIYAKASSGKLVVSYNESYRDGDNVLCKAMGDIVFSGKFAEDDLKKHWSEYIEYLQEMQMYDPEIEIPEYMATPLTDSMTSEVYAASNLYGGRLRIEDGAIYKGNGINVAAGSNATLRLAGGSLEQLGYTVLLNDTTTLDLEGSNSITASTMEMRDGSTLSFNTGATEGVILNLDSVLKTGDLHVKVSGDLTKEYALLQLADVSQYDFTQWNSGKVSVSGTDYEHLIWKDGVLTYKPWESTHTDLDKDTEVDDFGGEEGVDIEGNGHKLTVKHPVDLVHLAMENGVVRLEGENNNVVRITLTEDGTLQLAAGAGLNVGNIVSMVANGSADLEISGDIEISDIKAYGKPGNKGTLSYVNMTTAGDYTIENMTITGSVIDVGEGTTLYLVNVDIKSDTHITDDPAWVFAQNANIQLDKTNTWVDKEITAAQDTLLYMCGDTQRSITMAAGSEIVELTSSMFDTVTLTGTDLWLDMTGIAEATYNKDFFTLDFQDLAREMAKAQVDVENLHVYATLDGERYTEAYSTANGGLTTTLYFSVPEPATSALSLLALAAFAARRRRK